MRRSPVVFGPEPCSRRSLWSEISPARNSSSAGRPKASGSTAVWASTLFSPPVLGRCGSGPRGNYCRDLLDVSRQLDLFGLLGVPVQVSLGYPASRAPDSPRYLRKSSKEMVSARMKPFSKSVWITAAAWGAVDPLWTCQARTSFTPAVK